MSARTLILSDLHLGRGPELPVADTIAAFAPLWRDVDRLVLNGDSAEIHHPRTWGRAARCFMQLIDRCDEDGVELVVLSGNHDPWLSDRRHLSLAGGSVLVTHGDAMHPAVAPWSPAAGRMRRAHDRAVASLPGEIRDRLEGRLLAAQHASFAEWEDEATLRREAKRSTVVNMLLRPWSFLQVLAYWHAFPRLAAEFASAHAPEAQIIVTGHTHRPGLWRVGPRTVLNTGSFVAPTRPRAVLVDGGRVSLHRVVRDGSAWARVTRPLGELVVEALPASEGATASGKPVVPAAEEADIVAAAAAPAGETAAGDVDRTPGRPAAAAPPTR